jgi:hypothetical protein
MAELASPPPPPHDGKYISMNTMEMIFCDINAQFLKKIPPTGGIKNWS